MKRLCVLITAFERKIKAFDRQLNQRAGLDRIELIVPHACEVPAEVGGAAALVALMDQPGGSEAAPDKTIQIRVRHTGMKGSFLMPVEGLSLKQHADIVLVGSAPSWTILLFPPKLRTGEPNEVPWPLNKPDSQGWGRKLNLGITLRSVIFKRVTKPSSHDLNERLEIRLSRCEAF